MVRIKALYTLPITLTGLLAGCAAPSQQDASSAPSLIQTATDTNLVGATPQILSTEFGQPAILRVDGTAQVWLYHAAGCGLNLVLYPDSAGTPRVAMAAPTDDGADTSTCSAALQRAHADAAGAGSAESAAAAPFTPELPPPTPIPISAPVTPLPQAAPAAAGTLEGPDGALERPSSS